MFGMSKGKERLRSRYDVTTGIEEAVKLVIVAGEKGKKGETWIMDMGEEVNILELAKDLIKKSGKDVGINMIGARPGESMSEKLMTPEEKQLLINLSIRVDELMLTERYLFAKKLQLLDGRNIQVGKANGTKLGTESSQKLSLWGVTPIVQPSKISDPSGAGTAGVDSPARTAINSIIDVLEAIGLTSSS